MGAGISRKNWNDRLRRRLQSEARAAGGTYANYKVTGERNGVAWTAYFQTLRASNGESAGLLHVTIDGQDFRADRGVKALLDQHFSKGNK